MEEKKLIEETTKQEEAKLELSEKEIKRLERDMRKVATRREVVEITHGIATEICKPLWEKLQDLRNIVRSLVTYQGALVRFILDKKLATEDELQKYLDEIVKETIEMAKKESEKEKREEGEREKHEGDVNGEKTQE